MLIVLEALGLSRHCRQKCDISFTGDIVHLVNVCNNNSSVAVCTWWELCTEKGKLYVSDTVSTCTHSK